MLNGSVKCASTVIIICALLIALPLIAWATPVMNRSTQPAKYVADYDYGSNVITILTCDDTWENNITPIYTIDFSTIGFKANLNSDAYLPIAYAKATMINDVVYIFGRLDEDISAIAIVDCNNLEHDPIFITLADPFAKSGDAELAADYERKGALMLSQSSVYPNPGLRTQDDSIPTLNLYIAYADKYIQCSYDADTGEVMSATTVSIPKEPKGTTVFVPDPSLENMVWQDKESGRVYMYSDSSTICNLNPGRVYSIQDTYVLDDYIVLVSRNTVVLYSKASKQSTLITYNNPVLNRPYVVGLEDDVLQLLWFPYEWSEPDAYALTDQYELPTP